MISYIFVLLNIIMLIKRIPSIFFNIAIPCIYSPLFVIKIKIKIKEPLKSMKIGIVIDSWFIPGKVIPSSITKSYLFKLF